MASLILAATIGCSIGLFIGMELGVRAYVGGIRKVYPNWGRK